MNDTTVRNNPLARSGAVLAVIGALLLLSPLVLGTYGTRLLSEILIWSIYAMSFDLMLGYLGLISFGHSAFWGTGAYMVGILLGKGIISNFWLILLCSAGAGTVLALLFGLMVMRTSDIYFTFVTLALSQAMLMLSIKWSGLTGGIDGISGLVLPYGVDEKGFYYLVLAVYAICLALISGLGSARYGRVLIGIRENESRMKALGYNIWIYKYSCYVVAGTFGAVAGSLAAYSNSIVSVEDYSFVITGTAILMVLIGGKASQLGCLIGAAFITLLNRIVSTYTDHWLLVVGLVFVFIVLFAKDGFTGYLKRLTQGKTNASPVDKLI